MRKILISLLLIIPVLINAQDQDSILIRKIFDDALTSRVAYENLRWLCKNTKGRIAGTPEAAAAVEFTRQVMLHMGLDTVYLQELMVKCWKRGDIEYARVTSSKFGSEDLDITGLGTSIGTDDNGVVCKVIEVHSFEELAQLGEKEVKGKIVFFNRPWDPTHINTFRGYGGAVNQRTSGAAEAAKYGAVATIIRSATSAIDDHPHPQPPPTAHRWSS